MLDKKRGYAEHRPFYFVDTNVNIRAGMIAFLANNGTTDVATTAASGTVPIGTFWKDRATTYIRTAIETVTFNAAGIVTLSKGNVLSTGDIRVTDATQTNVAIQGADYTVGTNNGIVTRIPGGAIPALATGVIWYKYVLQNAQVYWNDVSTSYTATGYNYDRQPDDTMGSSKITVVEGWAQLYTDQYDVTMTYVLNHELYSDANSMWTPIAGTTTACGRVIHVPSASDPFLGVQQVTVAI